MGFAAERSHTVDAIVNPPARFVIGLREALLGGVFAIQGSRAVYAAEDVTPLRHADDTDTHRTPTVGRRRCR